MAGTGELVAALLVVLVLCVAAFYAYSTKKAAAAKAAKAAAVRVTAFKEALGLEAQALAGGAPTKTGNPSLDSANAKLNSANAAVEVAKTKLASLPVAASPATVSAARAAVVAAQNLVKQLAVTAVATQQSASADVTADCAALATTGNGTLVSSAQTLALYSAQASSTLGAIATLLGSIIAAEAVLVNHVPAGTIPYPTLFSYPNTIGLVGAQTLTTLQDSAVNAQTAAGTLAARLQTEIGYLQAASTALEISAAAGRIGGLLSRHASTPTQVGLVVAPITQFNANLWECSNKVSLAFTTLAGDWSLFQKAKGTAPAIPNAGMLSNALNSIPGPNGLSVQLTSALNALSAIAIATQFNTVSSAASSLALTSAACSS